MKRTQWQSLGMAIFTLAASAFIGLSVVVKGTFSEMQLPEQLDAHPEALPYLQGIGEAPPVWAYSRVSEALHEYAQKYTDIHGITEAELEQLFEILGDAPSAYSESMAREVFADKAPAIQEYTGWMQGREWESKSTFQSAFREKVAEANESTLREAGIGADRRRELIDAVITAAAPAWLANGIAAWLIFGLAVLGGLIYYVPDLRRKPGIHHNGIYHHSMQNRGWQAWIVFVLLVLFYIILYQMPGYLAHQVALLEPLARHLSGGASGRWFLYGFMYTLAMLVLGTRMMLKYRGNAYQQVRTVSVLFFQVAFAFTLPQIMTRLQLPAYDLKSAWPLEYSFFFDYRMGEMMQAGTLGWFLLFWGIALFALGVPLLTYFYGKRWYCSWVCGCGGLAETVGDPYRHLSDKSLKAWKIERWLVHGVLVFAVVMTAFVLFTTLTGDSEVLGVNSYSIRGTYGFFIGFVFAGAVGTGFYPVMGNRVWCRFGCPLAAYLGLVQRFKSRFRITTNGGQCISCGNCSTYCEMGIDVRWYAQRGQNIVRSSCVGCGVCSAVCPRGVLRLENKREKGRINDNPILIGRDGISLNV